MLVASISVALYYNITFFGKALVALPSLPVTAACLLYYLSAFNTTPPGAQVLLWMLSFAIAGSLWWLCLSRALQYDSNEETSRRSEIIRRVQRTLWLYALPLPWLLWIHAQSSEGPSLEALRGAILVRDNLYWNSQGSQSWLNALYLTLATLETFWTGRELYQTSKRWKTTFLMVSLAGSAALLTICALAQLFFQLS